jgi:hypothetical protein
MQSDLAGRTATEVRNSYPKVDKPQSAFDEMSKTLQDQIRRINLITEEIKTLQVQIFGRPDAPEGASTGVTKVSISVRDHLADLEAAIGVLEVSVGRFR